MFSQDRDMLAEATKRQRAGTPFGGVAYADQLGVTIGQAIDSLELLAQVYDGDDIRNRVEYLPY
jgi:hypothetical protein